MVEQEWQELVGRATAGDQDAVDEVVELAAERGDLEVLRRLSELGSRDALAELLHAAAEAGDLSELQRLADAGSKDAADVLAELEGDDETG